MRNTDEALATLRSLSGIDSLAFDADGQVELIFEKQWRVAVVRVDDASLELLSELPKLGSGLSRDQLVRLSTANYLGEAVGAGRIAVDPRDETVSYGRRIDVTRLDDDALEAVFADFLRFVAFWNSPAAAATLGSDGSPSMSSASLSDFIVRI